MGRQGHRLKRENKTSGIDEVWGGDLHNSSYVVAFFNRGDAETEITVSIKNDMKRNVTSYEVRDAIEHKSLGVMKDDVIKATVKKHAIKVYVLKFLDAGAKGNLMVEE